MSTQSNNAPLYNLTTNNWWVDDDEPVFPPDLRQLTVSRNMFVEFKAVDETAADKNIASMKKGDTTVPTVAFVSELVAKKNSQRGDHQSKPTSLDKDEFVPDLVVDQRSDIIFRRAGMPVLPHVEIFADTSPETLSMNWNGYPGARVITPPTKVKEIIVIDDDDDEELSLAPRFIMTPKRKQIKESPQKRGATKKSSKRTKKLVVKKTMKKTAKVTMNRRKVKAATKKDMVAAIASPFEGLEMTHVMDDDEDSFVRSMLIDDTDWS
jgi:hypothetical protein